MLESDVWSLHLSLLGCVHTWKNVCFMPCPFCFSGLFDSWPFLFPSYEDQHIQTDEFFLSSSIYCLPAWGGNLCGWVLSTFPIWCDVVSNLKMQLCKEHYHGTVQGTALVQSSICLYFHVPLFSMTNCTCFPILG
jgi:hypothetical protein